MSAKRDILIRRNHRRRYLEYHRKGEGRTEWRNCVLLVPSLDKGELRHIHLDGISISKCMFAVVQGVSYRAFLSRSHCN